jgi:hypothetical protein
MDRSKEWLTHDKANIGTYIELGAYDGVQERNTRFFDGCLGWDGLLLEANPRIYQRTMGTRPALQLNKNIFAIACGNPGRQGNECIA